MLSVLCITRASDAVLPLLRELAQMAAYVGAECLLAADGAPAAHVLLQSVRPLHVIQVTSLGYVESVLDEAIAATNGDYVLRVDDDERLDPELVGWIKDGGYRDAYHWQFRRAHLYPDPQHYLRSAPFWPDYQTRLSRRELAGGRSTIHAKSPFGLGEIGPGVIEHHKFLLYSYADRVRQAKHYEGLAKGSASGKFTGMTLPEHVKGIQIAKYPTEVK